MTRSEGSPHNRQSHIGPFGRSVQSLLPPLIASLCLAGCATTDPGKGARIHYRLPATGIQAVLSVDVVECQPFKLETSLVLNAVAVPGKIVYEVDGADLSSSVTKRGLVIDVDDRGVIAGINANATDQKSVIVGNVVKLAAVAAGTALPMRALSSNGTVVQWKLACSDKASSLVSNGRALKNGLDQARADIYSNPTVAKEKQAQIDALAKQLTFIKQSLHKESIAVVEEKDVQIGTTPLKFDLEPLDPLFDSTEVITGGSPNVRHGIQGTTPELFEATITFAKVDSPAALRPAKQQKSEWCSLFMKVPTQDLLQAKVTPGSQGLIHLKDPLKSIEAIIPASKPDGQELCLSAAYGENRTVKLKYDKFGQVNSFDWSSDATAATATSAIAGSAQDAATLVKSIHDRDLTADKSELDRLTTEQALKKARACQDALDAGGTCP
jgi:hypothetical protein